MMNVINTIKTRAAEAWSCDDGQMSREEVAISVARQAAREGLIQKANIVMAAKVLAEHLRQTSVGRPGKASPDPTPKYTAEEQAQFDLAERDWYTANPMVRVLVDDDDGGQSWEMRRKIVCHVDGCGSLGELIRQRVPRVHDVERADADANDAAARDFIARMDTMTPEDRKRAYWSLPNAVRCSGAMRSLPKAVRRNF